MRPGALSEGGFLGECERLEDVLARDRRTLARLGVTYDELAGRLGALIRAAPARVGHLVVEVAFCAGRQVCPWSSDIHHRQCTAGGGVEYDSCDWLIRNLRSRQVMCGPGLIVHLIRDHHFFEGVESPYRVDPAELARLLELVPSQ